MGENAEDPGPPDVRAEYDRQLAERLAELLVIEHRRRAALRANVDGPDAAAHPPTHKGGAQDTT